MLRSKIRTLQRCYKLWRYLEDNPFESKSDAYRFFRWQNSKGQEDYNLCPCCDYVQELVFKQDKRPPHIYTPWNPKCKNFCLIDWGTYKRKEKTIKSSCLSATSPFRKWDKSTTHDMRQKHATAIVVLTRKAILREEERLWLIKRNKTCKKNIL